jgi:hypothetical protein
MFICCCLLLHNLILRLEGGKFDTDYHGHLLQEGRARATWLHFIQISMTTSRNRVIRSCSGPGDVRRPQANSFVDKSWPAFLIDTVIRDRAGPDHGDQIQKRSMDGTSSDGGCREGARRVKDEVLVSAASSACCACHDAMSRVVWRRLLLLHNLPRFDAGSMISWPRTNIDPPDKSTISGVRS